MNPNKLKNVLLAGIIDGKEVEFAVVLAKILLYKDKKQHHIKLNISQPV
jgi:hypothetical protein